MAAERSAKRLGWVFKSPELNQNKEQAKMDRDDNAPLRNPLCPAGHLPLKGEIGCHHRLRQLSAWPG
jgi:hypothetical protein